MGATINILVFRCASSVLEVPAVVSLEQRGNAVTTVPTAKSLLESGSCLSLHTLVLVGFGGFS